MHIYTAVHVPFVKGHDSVEDSTCRPSYVLIIPQRGKVNGGIIGSLNLFD